MLSKYSENKNGYSSTGVQMVMPDNVKKYFVDGLDNRYTISHEYIVDFKPRWVARIDGAYIAWSDDQEHANELCRLHAKLGVHQIK